MKDVRQDGLDLGMSEARKLLNKKVSRGSLSAEGMIEALSNITPTLDYSGVDRLILWSRRWSKILTLKSLCFRNWSNWYGMTPSYRPTPQRFRWMICRVFWRVRKTAGCTFLIGSGYAFGWVIRGEASSEQTIATTVAYARQLGKTPIVVNNCPGFLVNRVLFPYFGAFAQLIHDGADFRQIDKAMERFGWPMGPAYLLDVGDRHWGPRSGVMAAGFERMQQSFLSIIKKLFDAGDLGQKTGQGFTVTKRIRKVSQKASKPRDRSAHR